MRQLIPLASLSLLLAGPLAGQDIVGRNDRTFNLSESVGAGNWVRISTFNGRISITPGNGNRVEIRAVKDIRRGEIEDVGFVVMRERGGITVCAVWVDRDECDVDGSLKSGNHSGSWSREHQGRVEFTVQIPSGVRVRAGSGNGDVSISGGGAEVIAATGNGRVDIAGTTGEVKASTGNGAVTVQDARGPVDASTGNGEIRVTTSTGPVSANSGNGEIDVSIGKLDRASDMSFSTGNGQVTLHLPDGFGAELDARTGNGHVSTDFPVRMIGRIDKSRIRGTLGEGGRRLSVISGNGDVEILRKP